MLVELGRQASLPSLSMQGQPMMGGAKLPTCLGSTFPDLLAEV